MLSRTIKKVIRLFFMVIACAAVSCNEKNQQIASADGISSETIDGESSLEPYSLKLILDKKEIFQGEPLYFSIVAASSPMLKKENNFSVFIISAKALEPNRSKRGFVITTGRAGYVKSSQTTLYGTSYDVTWISINNGVEILNPLNAIGEYTCKASANLMDGNRQIFQLSSEIVAVKVREPTERESSIVAMLDRYKIVAKTYSLDSSKLDKMFFEYADQLRQELKDPNVPLREELTVMLIQVLDAIENKMKHEEDRDNVHKEMLTLMMNIHPSHKYLRWRAYTGGYHSEGPIRIFEIMRSFKDREPTFDFPWDKMLEQWEEEMPIQPQISQSDIDEYYTPSFKMIEKLAKKHQVKN